MNHVSPRRHFLPLVGLASAFAAACGGGGGGGGPTTGTLSGQLLVPSTAAATLAAQDAADEVDALRPMIPDEVVVYLEHGQPPPDLTAEGLDLVRASGGPIAVYRPRAAATRFSRAEGAKLADSKELATCRAARGVRGKAGIRAASPNYLVQATFTPNDTHFAKQWHYPQINLPQAWDVTTGSSNVIVAVLDTGIVAAHPDFDPARFVSGFDMISDPARARDGTGFDSNPEDEGDLATPQGSSFHGTHVAGTIGARSNNGGGVAGVDHNCKLMIVRVLGQNGGSTADIADGIRYAARLSNSSNTLPATRADIVNMSLGAPGLNAVLESACNDAAAAGCLLVAAAGNDNTGDPGSPAAFNSVLSVGAVDLVRARAPYSNFHTSIDLWAPGGDMTADLNGDGFPDGVLSCGADDSGNFFFVFENGTSMASPHVAGVAALVKAANPGASAAQIRSVLLNNTQAGVNLPNSGRVLDALAAVLAAGGATSGPLLVATPTSIDFGALATTASVTLENRGTTSPGNLLFQSVTFSPSAPWVVDASTANPTANNIDVDRLDFTVDRSGLPAGVQQTVATLNFLNGSTPFSINVSLRLQVGGAAVSGDTVFVLLVDPDTFETLFQTETTAASGFAFTFGAVTPGDYLLAAGTDRNNDNDISDAAELFGVFPSLDQVLVIDVAAGETISDLDFALEEQAEVMALERGPQAPPRRAFRRLR